MSVSSLRAIEACPRQWALENASYPELWSGPGYPPRTRLSRLKGSVAHRALAMIIRRLALANCSSISDPCAPTVIRELGGFRSILQSCIEKTIARQADNPRLRDVESLQLQLERSILGMQADIQSLLRTIPLVPSNRSQGTSIRKRKRSRLGPGTYSEIEVRAPSLHWKGFLDLLVIGPDGAVEIRDYKTGAPTDKHKFQVMTYAVLWSADGELNPSGSLPARLTISYPGSDVAVPVPDAEGSGAVKAELHARSTAARVLASSHPPEARTSIEGCKRCDVRHLCPEYWQESIQRRLSAQVDEIASRGDLQVRVLSRRGPFTWDAVVERSDRIESDTPVTLQARGARHRLDEGAVLRLLDAKITIMNPDEAEDRPDIPLVSLTSGSEVFALS